MAARHIQLSHVAVIQPTVFETASDGRLFRLVGGQLGRLDLSAAFRGATRSGLGIKLDPLMLTDEVKAFLTSIRPLTMVDDVEIRLITVEPSFDFDGTILRFNQVIDGTPIDSGLVLMLGPTGDVLAISGLLGGRDLMPPTSRWIDEFQARRIAIATFTDSYERADELFFEAAHLTFRFASPSELHPIWRFTIKDSHGDSFFAEVDAVSKAGVIWDGLIHSNRQVCAPNSAPNETIVCPNPGEPSDQVVRIRDVGDGEVCPGEPAGSCVGLDPYYRHFFDLVSQIEAKWSLEYPEACCNFPNLPLSIVLKTNNLGPSYHPNQDSILFPEDTYVYPDPLNVYGNIFASGYNASNIVSAFVHEYAHRVQRFANPNLSFSPHPGAKAIREGFADFMEATYSYPPDWSPLEPEVNAALLAALPPPYEPRVLSTPRKFSDPWTTDEHTNGLRYANFFYRLVEEQSVSLEEVQKLVGLTTALLNEGGTYDYSPGDVKMALEAATAWFGSHVQMAIEQVWSEMDGYACCGTGLGGGPGGGGGGGAGGGVAPYLDVTGISALVSCGGPTGAYADAFWNDVPLASGYDIYKMDAAGEQWGEPYFWGWTSIPAAYEVAISSPASAVNVTPFNEYGMGPPMPESFGIPWPQPCIFQGGGGGEG